MDAEVVKKASNSGASTANAKKIKQLKYTKRYLTYYVNDHGIW